MSFKLWKILLVSLVVMPVMANTDVYLTNNSSQPLTIQVSHDGSDTLEYGEEWQQPVETLGPWETKSVLSFNRWEGVKSGQIYRFNTVV